MNALLRIAARNLFRQRRRSMLTGASIALGVMCSLFAVGFLNGTVDTMMQLTVEANIGAIQIHKKGYSDADEPLKFDLPQDDALRAKVLSVPNVKAMAPRLTFDGLLNNGQTASILIGTAIEKEQELQVCPGREEQLGTSALGANDMILGDELARNLGLQVGSTATVLAASQKGASNALDATVSGMLEVKLPTMAKMVGVMSLSFAQRLLRMPNRVTEYALSVAKLRDARATAEAIQVVLGPDYEVETWRERDPTSAAAIDRFAVVVGLIIFILFLLVGSSVVNSMLMSVQERVREIGTMMAVGVKRRQVLGIVLAEAAVLAFVASLIGALFGLALILYYGQKGVVFDIKGMKAFVVLPYATVKIVGLTVLGAEAGAIISAFYPAFKASRLSPVEALRSV